MNINSMIELWGDFRKRASEAGIQLPEGCFSPFEIELAALDELRTSGAYAMIGERTIADIALATPPEKRFGMCMEIGDRLCGFSGIDMDHPKVELTGAERFPACICLRVVSVAEIMNTFRTRRIASRGMQFYYTITDGQSDKFREMIHSLSFYYPWLELSFFPEVVIPEESNPSKKNTGEFMITAALRAENVQCIDTGRIGVLGKVLFGEFKKNDNVYMAEIIDHDGHMRFVGSPGKMLYMWLKLQELEKISESCQPDELLIAMDLPSGQYGNIFIVKGEKKDSPAYRSGF